MGQRFLGVLVFGAIACVEQPMKEPVEPDLKRSTSPAAYDPTPLPEPQGPQFLALGQTGLSNTFQSEVTIFRTAAKPDCPNCIQLRVVYDGKHLRSPANNRPVESLEFDFTDACPYLGRKAAQTFRQVFHAPRAPIAGNIDVPVKLSLCDPDGLVSLSAKRHVCENRRLDECKKQEVIQSFTTTLSDLLDLQLFTSEEFPNRVIGSGG